MKEGRRRPTQPRPGPGDHVESAGQERAATETPPEEASAQAEGAAATEPPPPEEPVPTDPSLAADPDSEAVPERVPAPAPPPVKVMPRRKAAATMMNIQLAPEPPAETAAAAEPIKPSRKSNKRNVSQTMLRLPIEEKKAKDETDFELALDVESAPAPVDVDDELVDLASSVEVEAEESSIPYADVGHETPAPATRRTRKKPATQLTVDVDGESSGSTGGASGAATRGSTRQKKAEDSSSCSATTQEGHGRTGGRQRMPKRRKSSAAGERNGSRPPVAPCRGRAQRCCFLRVLPTPYSPDARTAGSIAEGYRR